MDLDAHTGTFDRLCVNVGKKISDRDTMETQSEKGAIWIPACLLQIESHQLVKGVLGTEHIKDMINHALRLPGPNANLIVQEGFRLLGINNEETKASEQLVSCCKT